VCFGKVMGMTHRGSFEDRTSGASHCKADSKPSAPCERWTNHSNSVEFSDHTIYTAMTVTSFSGLSQSHIHIRCVYAYAYVSAYVYIYMVPTQSVSAFVIGAKFVFGEPTTNTGDLFPIESKLTPQEHRHMMQK